MPRFLFSTIVDWLFPPLCWHCQREGAWLCPDGWRAIQALPVLVDPLQIDGVDRVYCRGSYDDPLLAGLITGLKYHGWQAYRQALPALFAPMGAVLRPWSASMIIPVPLHARRQRWRGFNQADLIGDALGTIISVPTASCLRRKRSTTAQAKLGAKAREHNLADAFSLVSGVEMRGKCGILVDDVITTGSTTRECASVLRQAGMEQIIAVALAKG